MRLIESRNQPKHSFSRSSWASFTISTRVLYLILTCLVVYSLRLYWSAFLLGFHHGLKDPKELGLVRLISGFVRSFHVFCSGRSVLP